MQLIEGHKLFQPADSVPCCSIDPFDESILRAPHDYFRSLREAGPVVYISKWSVLAVAQHASCVEVFNDHQRFVSSRGVGLNDFAIGEPWRPPSIILEADPPDHTRTRSVMAKVLSPDIVKSLVSLFDDCAERLVASLPEHETLDAVIELAERFPVEVFSKAVGLRETNARYLVDYGACVFNAMGPDNRLRRHALKYSQQIAPWIMQCCRREHLNEDGLGARIYAEADAGVITEDEAAMLVRSLLSAGIDTTVSTIGNAVFCFADNPDQWSLLCEQPDLFRPAVEEVLRYSFPVHTFGRTAGMDTTLAGCPIEEGSKMLVVMGAANHDPERWGDPEVFRIDRKPRGHLAFGAGIHGCVGQNLARAEVAALLGAMSARVRQIQFVGEAKWRPGNAVHALDTLPVKLLAR